jgi:hypothetical protein
MKLQHHKNLDRFLAGTQERKIDLPAKRHPGEKSGHILSVSSNLLGICFIVLTSIKVLGKANETIIDEIAALCILLFMTSCILSFLSIRWIHKKSTWLEDIADVVFLAGLSLLFVTTVLFSFNIIQ